MTIGGVGAGEMSEKESLLSPEPSIYSATELPGYKLPKSQGVVVKSAKTIWRGTKAVLGVQSSSGEDGGKVTWPVSLLLILAGPL